MTSERAIVLSSVGPTLRLPNLGLDGWIDRIDVYEGERAALTTTPVPPLPLANGRGSSIPLPGPLPDEVTAIGLTYREIQPSVGPGPPRRRSFTNIERTDKEPPMTDQSNQRTTSGPNPTAEADTAGGESQLGFTMATVDFGTTRSIGVIRDLYKRYSDSGRPLSAEAVRRAGRVLGDNPSKSGMAIEFDTEHLPSRRMEAWDAAFSAPPLARERLEVVTDFSSDLVVLGEDSYDFRSERPHGEGSIVLLGVKRYLSFPGHRLAEVDREADGVVVAAVDRLARYTARGRSEDDGMETTFGTLHLTYPTKLPADRRDVLVAGVEQLGHHVRIEVDEAAGAAGFWVMCRFGEDSDLGVEAFKATARCHTGQRAWENPTAWRASRAWHENWLIVDVGGGTTDCAAVRLSVLDVTPAAIPPDLGRFHRIEPQITASGGIINLGGDQLTKSLFLLLKKSFGVVNETKFDGAVAESKAERRTNFDRLWTAAEQVKHLGYSEAELTPVRVIIGDRGSDRFAGDDAVVHIDGIDGFTPPVDEIVVTTEQLQAIAHPVLARLAALASGIAKAGSETTGGETVDRVALSGGSMLGTYLRNQLEARLRRSFAIDAIGDTFAVDFDATFCKTGTALGAMYFNAFGEFAPKPDRSIPLLMEGKRLVDVDISNMHANVAADFFLHRVGLPAVDGDRIFARGQTLTEGDDGIRRARSEVQGHRRTLNVTRQDFDGQLMAEEIEAEATGEPDDAADGGGSRPWASLLHLGPEDPLAFLADNELEMRFEIDELERIYLLLIKGSEDPAPDLGDGELLAVETSRPLVVDGRLQFSLADNLGAPDATRNPSLLFQAGQEIELGLVAQVQQGLVWMRAENDDEYVGLVEVPDDRPWLSIDGDGQLRCHRNRPPDIFIDRIDDLVTAPRGSMYRRRMETETAYQAEDDPFSGRL